MPSVIAEAYASALLPVPKACAVAEEKAALFPELIALACRGMFEHEIHLSLTAAGTLSFEFCLIYLTS